MLTIQQIRDTVADYFKDKPVKKVYLFGSYARGEAKEESDVDLLVEFDDSNKRLSLFDVLRFQVSLEEILKRDVGLIEEQAIESKRLLYSIAKDKIQIFPA